MEDILPKFKQLQKRLEVYYSNEHVRLDIELYKKLLAISQPGQYYYFTFDPKRVDFIYISPEIKEVLGYDAEEMNMALFASIIHPDDAPYFLNFEGTVGQFYLKLEGDKMFKYKARYDFRLRTKQGDYRRILHQLVILQVDPGFHNVVTFAIHTDITYLKKDGKPVFSMIGLDGEPSYIDIDAEKNFLPPNSPLSPRESEILELLIEGLQSKQIADRLSISNETVSKHRQNMLRKTETTTTAELVAIAIKKGWI